MATTPEPSWTEEQALQVLADGNTLIVRVPGYEGRDTYASDVVDGLYEVWLDEAGEDKPIAYLRWGTFTVTGYNIELGDGEEAEELADLLVANGAEDKREKRIIN